MKDTNVMQIIIIFFVNVILQVRKLRGLTDSVEMGRVYCSQMKQECDDLYISKTPVFILFKPGGGYEIHQVLNLFKI